MSNTDNNRLSEALFRARFLEAFDLYANKVEGSVFSVTDAAVAAVMQAQLPLFGTQLEVATCVQQYFAEPVDVRRQKIITDAFRRYEAIAMA
jgi:hypothetical protein